MRALPEVLSNFLRVAVKVAWTAAVAWLATKGIDVPDSALIEGTLFAVVAGAVSSVLFWLETRRGDGFWPTLGRRVAMVIMLGLTVSRPVYTSPSAVVRVDGKLVQ